MSFQDFGDLDSCASAGTRWSKSRSLLHFISKMDTIVINIIRASTANESSERLCSYWHRELRSLQIDVSFMDAAGCFDIRRCAFRE